jgi:predicted RNase H-like HicB family nuclease
MHLTAVFLEVPEGYIAFVEELPGTNTQGATLDEARENLQEAVALVLEANRGIAGHPAQAPSSMGMAAERPGTHSAAARRNEGEPVEDR